LVFALKAATVFSLHRLCLTEELQATIDYALLEGFTGQHQKPTTFEKDL
jgi:hypothetical protein